MFFRFESLAFDANSLKQMIQRCVAKSYSTWRKSNFGIDTICVRSYASNVNFCLEIIQPENYYLFCRRKIRRVQKKNRNRRCKCEPRKAEIRLNFFVRFLCFSLCRMKPKRIQRKMRLDIDSPWILHSQHRLSAHNSRAPSSVRVETKMHENCNVHHVITFHKT